MSGIKKQTHSDQPAVKPMDIGEIKTEFAAECRKTMQSLRQKYKNVKAEGVPDLAAAEKGATTLEGVVEELDKLAKEKKIPNNRLKTPVKHIQQQLVQVAGAGVDRSELERDLALALERDASLWLLSEILKLKGEVQGKLEILRAEISVFKKREVADALRARICALKGLDVAASKNFQVVREEISVLPAGIKETLWHPLWVSRKFERECGVLVEKISSSHIKFDGVVVSGFPVDVGNFVAKMDKLDFSGRRSLVLDSRSFQAAQSKIPEAEKISGAYVASPGGSEIVFLGSEKQVEKAVAALGNFREISDVRAETAGEKVDLVSEKVAIGNFFLARGFVSDSLGFLAEIDKAEKVAISVQTNFPTDHYLIVRGEAEAVARTTALVRKLLESEIWLQEISDHPMALFESPSGGRSRGIAESRVFAKFAALKRTPGIFVARHENSVGVVGRDEATVESVAGEVRKFMVAATYETEKFPLSMEHRRCWGERSCTLVAERSGGAELHRNSENFLEIWGPEETRKKAATLVQEFHRPVVIVTAPEFPISALMENKAMALTEIQELAAVHIYVDRASRKFFIYGLADCKEDAQEQLERQIEQIKALRSHLNIREISDLTSQEVGRLIGPKGSMIRRIKDVSGCEDVQVDDHKCILTGSKSAVDAAILFIEEIIDSKKSVIVIQGEVGELIDAPRTRILELNKNVDLPDGNVNKMATPAPPPVLESAEEFPSLAALAGKKNKKK